jgi:hypothetical protein
MSHPPQEGHTLAGPLFSAPMLAAAVRVSATTPVLCRNRNNTATIDWHMMTSAAHYHVTVDTLKRPTGLSDRPRAPSRETP